MDQKLRLGAIRHLHEGKTVIVRRTHHNRKACMRKPFNVNKGTWHVDNPDHIFARSTEHGVVRLTCPVHLCGGQRIACGNLWRSTTYQSLMCAHCCHTTKADRWYCECGIQLKACEVHHNMVMRMAEGVGSKHCPPPRRRLRVKTKPGLAKPKVRQRSKPALRMLTLWELQKQETSYEPYSGALMELRNRLMEREVDLGYAPSETRRSWIPKCNILLAKMPLLRAGMGRQLEHV